MGVDLKERDIAAAAAREAAGRDALDPRLRT
jgi:hypothetical protein